MATKMTRIFKLIIIITEIIITEIILSDNCVSWCVLVGLIVCHGVYLLIGLCVMVCLSAIVCTCWVQCRSWLIIKESSKLCVVVWGGSKVIVCIYIPCHQEELHDFYNNYQSKCLAH